MKNFKLKTFFTMKGWRKLQSKNSSPNFAMLFAWRRETIRRLLLIKMIHRLFRSRGPWIVLNLFYFLFCIFVCSLGFFSLSNFFFHNFFFIRHSLFRVNFVIFCQLLKLCKLPYHISNIILKEIFVLYTWPR